MNSLQPILIIVILSLFTLGVFVFTRPKKRPPFSAYYWNLEKMSPNDYAKMFSFSGEVDRLLEMLRVETDAVEHARAIKAAAAATGIPVLFHKHKVSRQDTEAVIQALLDNLEETPREALHAITVLSIGGYLIPMEEEIALELINLLNDPTFKQDEVIQAKTCEALGYLGNEHAVEPIQKVFERSGSIRVQKAAENALRYLGAQPGS